METLAAIQTPEQLLEALADFRFPGSTDARLQRRMDRNNEAELSAEEVRELEALADLSGAISIFRAQAMRFLGRKP